MSDHKADGRREHAARVRHHLASGGCARMASGGAVQENERSIEKSNKEVSGKSGKAQKPLFKRGGHKAAGKKSHARLDKKARGGPVMLKKGGKAKGDGPKINIVVAPHGQPGAAPGGLAGGPPMPPPRPPMPPMAGPPPGGAPMPGGMPPGGPPPGMPMRPPGMKSGGKAKDVSNGGDPDDTQKGFYKRGGNRKAAGGSVSAYEGKQEDLGEESRSQASNEDVNTKPPKRKAGGNVIVGMKKGGAMRHTLRHPVTKRFMRGGGVPKMEFGAGSAEGRLEKIRKYGPKPAPTH